MADATVSEPNPVPDFSKDPGIPEKVTTISHPADDASPTASPDQNGHADRDIKSTGTNGSTANGDSNGSLRHRINGGAKSYAAAVADEDSDLGSDDFPSGAHHNGPMKMPPPGEASCPDYEQEAWQAGGIRFAPIKIPFIRRMQTAAVLFHCMSIVSFVSIFWFTCANPLAWPILVPYLIHLSVSTAASNGRLSFRSEYLRSLPLWRLFASYFPMKLHRTHSLSPKKKYILGYHPHGIISHGAFCAFATNALGFAEKFPGITNTLLTLESNFKLPFYRDWILALGMGSVSRESITNLLTTGGPNSDGTGRAVTIVIGGARESLEAQPGTLRLVLHNRKGFVKMALRTGADLVPVVGFGETDLYDQLSPKTHPMVHKFQMVILKVFKFTLPALHGRGVLNYDIGLMPYRRPVNIVVGKPIEVGQGYGSQPPQEEIDRLHELYIQEVERLWDAYKDKFAPSRSSELEIIH
ncbi:unnamed protein product [Clonostachys solani]|uniref:Diacylglycerol O-acyltransferase n=1 Tax=Clonostachys solani TaxID=160281 RepID=A0A9P0EEU6_9HYPO|nr:unnamed protein product [Clonostachys solani]